MISIDSNLCSIRSETICTVFAVKHKVIIDSNLHNITSETQQGLAWFQANRYMVIPKRIKYIETWLQLGQKNGVVNVSQHYLFISLPKSLYRKKWRDKNNNVTKIIGRWNTRDQSPNLLSFSNVSSTKTVLERTFLCHLHLTEDLLFCFGINESIIEVFVLQ